MSVEEETAAYVEFLLGLGRISHIVTAASGAEVSTMALVQRCLASGAEMPVPLPDGTVAVHLPDGVPAALESLKVSVTELAEREEAQDAAPEEPGQGSMERLDAIDAALRDIEASMTSSEETPAAEMAPPELIDEDVDLPNPEHEAEIDEPMSAENAPSESADFAEEGPPLEDTSEPVEELDSSPTVDDVSEPVLEDDANVVVAQDNTDDPEADAAEEVADIQEEAESEAVAPIAFDEVAEDTEEVIVSEDDAAVVPAEEETLDGSDSALGPTQVEPSETEENHSEESVAEDPLEIPSEPVAPGEEPSDQAEQAEEAEPIADSLVQPTEVTPTDEEPADAAPSIEEATLELTPEQIVSDEGGSGAVTETPTHLSDAEGYAVIADKLDALSDAIAEQSRRLDNIAEKQEALASRPIPRLDTSEINRWFARFTTAFSQALARLERVIEENGLGSEVTTAPSGLDEIKANLSTVVTLLTEARSEGSDGAQIAKVIELQEVTMRQVSALMEVGLMGSEPVLSEFLTDLRHTIAELIADQKRLAIAV